MFTKKEQSCQNNLENSYTERKDKHEPSGCSMFTNVHLMREKINCYYRGIDCIKKWCKK